MVPFRRPFALGEREDDDLMLLARSGVAEAFDALVRRHQHAVLETARRQLGSLDLAKDAAQNTFVEVYRYLPRYDPRGKFKAFLYRVLLNHVRMLRRSIGRTVKLAVLLEVEPTSTERLPEDDLLIRERWREVEQSLERLSAKLRIVVTLRFAAELTYEEIAEVLDIEIGTVKSRLFNGVRKLREDLKA